MNSLYLNFLIVTFFAISLVFINSRVIFYSILLLSFFLDNILYILGLPATYDLIIDVFIIIYFIYAISKSIINKDIHETNDFGKKIKKYLFFFFGILILFNIYTIILNNVPIIMSIRAFLNFFRYFLFFMALIKLEDNPRFYYKIFNLIILIGLVQIPYSILQYIFYKGMSFDFKGGSISLSGYSTRGGGVFAAVMFTYYYMKYRLEKKKIYIIVSFLFFVPILISSARAAVIFVLLNTLFYYLYLEKSRFSKYVSVILWGSFLLLIGFYFIAYVLPILDPRNAGAIDLFTQTDKFQAYTENTTKIGRVNRIQFFYIWQEMYYRDLGSFLLGNGLGSYTYGSTLGIKGTGIQAHGLFLTGLHSFAYFALELGIISLALYLMFLGAIIKNIKKRFIKTSWLKDKLILGFTAVFFFALIYTSVYGKIWSIHGIAFTQWFLLATLTKLELKNKIYSTDY